MSAKLETCLFIGFSQTRFDAFDEVELKLTNGTRYFEVDTEKGVCVVYPEDLEV